MAAGDVAIKQERFQEAYDHYQICANEVKKYGGEGHDYQIAPRLGFAYLGLGDLERAKRHFEELRDVGQITVGRMYAEYGLARIAQATGQLEAAKNIIEHLKAQIASRSSSSLLLKLLDQVLSSRSRTATNKS